VLFIAEECEMERPFILTLVIVLLFPALCHGQVAGGAGSYGQSNGRARAEQNERNKRTLTQHDLPPTANSIFVESSVLMNVKADEYVAVFGIAREGATVAEANQKMDATVKEFTDRLKPLGVGPNALYVDFIAQNKVYDFEVSGDIAREKLTGFELKKNVSIHYKNAALLDKLLAAAAESQIFDLIKVDYIVKDIGRIQDRLMDEATRLIKQKTARYEKLLGTKVQSPPQVYAERPAIYYPTEMYDAYTAYESEGISSSSIRQRYTVQSARKTRTFYFNALNADGFDAVINPVTIEPVVQFTLYLKVKYNIGPNRAGAAPPPKPVSGTVQRKPR
jgi:uncharacterized protein YggE